MSKWSTVQGKQVENLFKSPHILTSVRALKKIYHISDHDPCKDKIKQNDECVHTRVSSFMCQIFVIN